MFHQPVNSQHLEQVTDKCSFTQAQILAWHLLTSENRHLQKWCCPQRDRGPLKTPGSSLRDRHEHFGRCGLKSSPTTRSSEPLLITRDYSTLNKESLNLSAVRKITRDGLSLPKCLKPQGPWTYVAAFIFGVLLPAPPMSHPGWLSFSLSLNTVLQNLRTHRLLKVNHGN